MQTQLCSPQKHGQVPRNSPEKISKLLLHMHLGISMTSKHANNSDIESTYTQLGQIILLWLHVYVLNVYISPRVDVPLFRSWCARLLPVLAAVSRQRSASCTGEKARWRLICAVSLSRTLSLCLVRGYSDVSCIALSLPRAGLTQILAWAVLSAWDGVPREKQRRPKRSHRVKHTFMMTYWKILICNTVFFFVMNPHSLQYSICVFLWRPCSYM